jgi:hypothetical protein
MRCASASRWHRFWLIHARRAARSGAGEADEAGEAGEGGVGPRIAQMLGESIGDLAGLLLDRARNPYLAAAPRRR